MNVMYCPSRIMTDPTDNLFALNYLKSEFILSTSFKKIFENSFIVFLDYNDYIKKYVEDNPSNIYAFILDYDNLENRDNKMREVLAVSNLLCVICISDFSEKYIREYNIENSCIKFIPKLYVDILDNHKYEDSILVSKSYLKLKNLNRILETNNLIKKIYVFDNDKFCDLKFEDFLVENKSVRVFSLLPFEGYLSLLNFCHVMEDDIYLPLVKKQQSYSVQHLEKFLLNMFDNFFKRINKNSFIKKERDLKQSTKNLKVNIICYKPSYLFKDLVDRFVSLGCIASDFPLSNYDRYIWLRPQELWHCIFIQNSKSHNDISKNYIKDFKSNNITKIDKNILNKSVAIHHGTCFAPLYQFCPFLLAEYLAKINKVYGVCSFADCYGPSAENANYDNFECVPIGFDENIFQDKFIRKNKENDVFNIGVVGRVYGTERSDLLEKSKLAEPYGYRKGVDFLITVCKSLMLKNFKFKLTILGANWDKAFNDMVELGIDVNYITRDQEIKYSDYPVVYKDFDMLFVASRCEGGPVPLMEALSLGIPVVSPNIGVAKFFEDFIDKKFLKIFNYNHIWSNYDINTAIKHIYDVYNSTITYDEKLSIRRIMMEYTTSNWLRKITFGD